MQFMWTASWSFLKATEMIIGDVRFEALKMKVTMLFLWVVMQCGQDFSPEDRHSMFL
jgi:hypothetical protein